MNYKRFKKKETQTEQPAEDKEHHACHIADTCKDIIEPIPPAEKIKNALTSAQFLYKNSSCTKPPSKDSIPSSASSTSSEHSTPSSLDECMHSADPNLKTEFTSEIFKRLSLSFDL
ncbi:hypothetical protein NEAUS03_0609 [Nematocida ausubeli]|nr:hypothetical protein NEAUS03_0609 [Nematocida ausubeli]